jgi:CRISPR type III-B/RAMP module RAMP protein Cmr1
MTPLRFHLELITPCFCAGATPSVAEIRAPSIRGKLRWWFRVLGGQRNQESEVFGAIAGNCGTSSALIVRVSEPVIQSQWQPINFSGISNTGYVLYFAKASGDGARWVAGGAVPYGASFELQILWKRNVSQQARELFDLALDAFLLLGSLGLRSTRGLGCFETKERPFGNEIFQTSLARIQKRAPGFRAGIAKFQGSQDRLLDGLGAQLRGLRNGYSAGKPGQSKLSPLGSSNPRQASAVYLRPVRFDANTFKIVVFEAPADKVLGIPSRMGAPRLAGGIPSPQTLPAGGGNHRPRY